MRGNTILMATVLFFATAASIGVEAAESRHFSFAYDQPHTTPTGSLPISLPTSCRN